KNRRRTGRSWTWRACSTRCPGKATKGSTGRTRARPGAKAHPSVVIADDQERAEEKRGVANQEQPRCGRAAFTETTAVDHHVAHKYGGDGGGEHDQQEENSGRGLARENAENEQRGGHERGPR